MILHLWTYQKNLDMSTIIYQDALKIVTTGPIEIIGPEIINLRGGIGGTYIKTTGEEGVAKVYLMRENDLVFIQEFIVKVK